MQTMWIALPRPCAAALQCFVALLPLAAGAAPTPRIGSGALKPHVLWIVVDDLGWDDLGFRNSHQTLTPVVDALASSGLVLTNYYVQPSCSPTRATFMSGRYPLRTGINNYIPPRQAYGLPLHETTVAQLMRRRSYRTHAVGKWHVGFVSYAHTPTFRGFESFYGFYGGGEDYFTHKCQGAYDLRRDEGQHCGRGCSHIAVEDSGVYSTTLFTREGVRIIKNHDPSEPLFMYLAYQAVHGPSEVPQHYVDPFNATIKDSKRRVFAGMLAAMDEGVGNVTQALRDKGMLETTVIIFTTDNGGPSETCGVTGTSNFPHRGSKCSIWEGGTRGTAFVTGHGLYKRGFTFSGLMHAADWLPTVVAMTGEPVHPTETLQLDGVNQWPALSQGVESPRREIYYGVTDAQVGLHGPAFQAGGMKLIVGNTGGKPGLWPAPANKSALTLAPSTRTSPAGVSHHFPHLENTTYLLFNMTSDENEHTDIAANYPSIVRRLLDRVKEITKEVACMDCPDPRCPDAVHSQVNVMLPDGSITKAWEPFCDDVQAAGIAELVV